MVSFFGWGSSPSSDASQTTQEKSTPEQPQAPPKEPELLPFETPRPPLASNTNLKLLFGGMVFSALTVLVTRRSFNKKRIACIPPFYTSSLYHQPHSNSAMDAFEALNLATLNVLSFGMMAGGAAGYALNINNIDDMRKFVRAGLQGGSDTPVKSDEELEEEVTEWVSKVLGDKFEKQLEKEKMKRAFQQAQADQAAKEN
ncbi:hypothetical protein N7541_004653 [Penicillium brevicompactum]|uniref:Altered inheritance of mitochondria protein 11 n=1 Tax=Penicillium brevicompactum TaxID=5074 RepID=A0A9W9RDH0_PENBR|nr:hypothetical protein N7541_004653 [Penicillium brevicompactum]